MRNIYLDKTQAEILLNFITGKQKPNIAEMRELIILESQLIELLKTNT